MATEVIMRMVPGGAMCVNQPEASKIEDMVGQELMVTIKRPRNLQFHKLYFALIKTAHDLANTEYNIEQFRAVCTVGAGYVEWFNHDGNVVAIPKSVSFASMDQTEFERLYRDTVNFVCNNWVVNQKQLEDIVAFL